MNQVSRAPTPAVLALVQQACEVLPQFDAALRACKPEARILPIGFASGVLDRLAGFDAKR